MRNMLKLPLVFAFLGLVAGSAMAQSPKESAETVKAAAMEPTSEADSQQRRNDLRAALKAQTSVAIKSEPSAAAGRQLTPQERADLRQQLRQQ